VPADSASGGLPATRHLTPYLPQAPHPAP
jgi:hypothetical protein